MIKVTIFRILFAVNPMRLKKPQSIFFWRLLNQRIRKMFPKIAHPVAHYFDRNRESQPILQGFCSAVEQP